MFWSRLDCSTGDDGLGVTTLCGIANPDAPGDKTIRSFHIQTVYSAAHGGGAAFGQVQRIWCADDGSGKLPHPEREDDALSSEARRMLRSVLGRAAHQDALFGWSGLCRGSVAEEGALPQRVRDEVRLAFTMECITRCPPCMSLSDTNLPAQFTLYGHGSMRGDLWMADAGNGFQIWATAELFAMPRPTTLCVRVVAGKPARVGKWLPIPFLSDLCTVIVACWDKRGLGYGHVLDALTLDMRTFDSDCEPETVIAAETVRDARVLVDDPVVPSDMYYFVFRADDLLAIRDGTRTARHARVPWASEHGELLTAWPMPAMSLDVIEHLFFVVSNASSDVDVSVSVTRGEFRLLAESSSHAAC